jgi:hypothetical protein
MAKSRESGATILLGLRRHEAGKVIKEGKRIVVEAKTHLKKPACHIAVQRGYAGMGDLRSGRCFRAGVKAGEFT